MPGTSLAWLPIGAVPFIVLRDRNLKAITMASIPSPSHRNNRIIDSSGPQNQY